QRQVVLGRKSTGSGFQAAGGKSRCVSMTLITTLYITRQIDYTYRDSDIVAAAARQATGGPDGADGNLENVAAAPVVPNINLIVTGEDTEAVSLTDAQFTELTEALQAGAGGTGSGPGRSASFASWDARGLTLSETYRRPVVIGWDGYDLFLDKDLRQAGKAWARSPSQRNKAEFIQEIRRATNLVLGNTQRAANVLNRMTRDDLALRTLANACSFEDLASD
ncbi:MAG: hypothetical protein AAGA78_10270, partial [Pseudomonadota bacterium]